MQKVGEDAWLDHEPGWLEADEATALQDFLREAMPWEQRSIRLFGKDVLQPRLIAWGGTASYSYSGDTLPARPLPDPLEDLRLHVADECGVPFNHVLLNRYRDGRDSMGWHADNEPELGPDPVVASLSLGAERRFAWAHRRRKNTRQTLMLGHGSLLVMGGAFQHHWRHSLPKMARAGERINLTFRWVRT